MKFFPSRGLLLLVPLSLLPFFAALAERGDRSAQLDFGVEAARKGLWREALFRWEKAHKLSPNNPRILNNLAVASENTGDFEKADGFYQEALRLQPGNQTILVTRLILLNDNPKVDLNREFVGLLKREIRKKTRLKVVEVEPPPLPEQSLEDLVANSLFWKDMAEKFGADLILTGSLG